MPVAEPRPRVRVGPPGEPTAVTLRLDERPHPEEGELSVRWSAVCPGEYELGGRVIRAEHSIALAMGAPVDVEVRILAKLWDGLDERGDPVRVALEATGDPFDLVPIEATADALSGRVLVSGARRTRNQP